MKNGRPVIVVELPEQLTQEGVQEFQREVSPLLKADRPRMVFDFSQVWRIDSAGVEMLLHCLEATMKRDGDLKLAAVAPQAAVILELTRVDRLFEVFETSADAVESFDGFQIQSFQGPYPSYAPLESGLGDLKMTG